MNKSCLFSLLIVFSINAYAEPVHICDDSAEWPPYAFYQRDGDTVNKDVVTGGTYDLVQAVFNKIGMEYTYALVPWKRCLQEVKNFDKAKKYEIIANAGYNEERDQTYLITLPIYRTHQGYFYSTEAFPDGPPAKSISDMNNYKVCGINGYNYTMYSDNGLTAKMDMGASNLQGIMGKLHNKRCDIFPSSLEPVYGMETIGAVDFKGVIKGMPISELKKTDFHLYVSRSSDRGEELRNKINDAIKEMQGSGEAETIYKKYLPDGSGI